MAQLEPDFTNYTRSSQKPRRAKWQKAGTEFVYCDERGQEVFRVFRQLASFGTNRPAIDEETGKQKKRCWQRWKNTPDGKKPKDAPILPYRLPELIAAVNAGRTVFVVEGEPKVETLRNWGLAATCNAEGAGKWRAQHAEFLRGANVVILPDNDAPGRDHADRVGRSLEGIATQRRLLELPDLPDHGDIVDWVKAGGTKEQFERLVGEAPEWKPYGPAGEVEKGRSQDELLARLNAEYCVVEDSGKVRVLRFDAHTQMKDGKVVHTRLVPTFLAFGDFHNYFKNEKVWVEDKNGGAKPMPLGNWWTSHPQRRTYRGLAFRPDKPSEMVIDGRLNLWRGWGVEPKPGDWSLMRQHIKEVLAADDDEADAYIVNWLAWAAQHAAEPAEVALVLIGGRGTGKGTLGNAMCYLFGQHATHISSVRHLVGHFNAHLRDACLLFADEAYWPGDKAGEGTLKRLITEPTLQIEPKFVDVITVPNMLHVLMASNEDWVVPAGEHERRYAVFQVSEQKRQDETWFKPLYEQLASGGYSAMLHDLLHQELGDWHPRKIPMTEALREQQRRSLKPLDAWVLKFFEDGALPEGVGADRPERALSRSKPDVDGRNPRNGLYDLAREQPALRHVDEQVLAAHLKQWGCTPWRSNLARGWEFPPLAQCRARWQEKYPGWTWQHPELTEWQKDDNTGPAF